MRILHLVSYPLFSGPLPPTLGLAQAQQKLGHQVTLAIDSKRPPPNEYEEAAMPHVRDLDLAPSEPLALSTKSSLLDLWRDRRAVSRLARQHVDVMHVHMSHDHALAVAAGVRRHLPLVRTLHASRSLLPRFGQAWLNRRADGWIARCAVHRSELQAQTRAPVEVIPGSVDTGVFSPANPEQRRAARRVFGISTTAKLLIHVALIAGRGQEELAGALVRLNSPDLVVLFVGRGEAEAPLKLLCEAAGLTGKTLFAGYLSGSRLLRAYHAADAAFVAQPGNDASARAALEAMASGLPLVAVAEGALEELVNDDIGYPVKTRKPEAIAQALRLWLADDTALARGLAGRHLVSASRTRAIEAERAVAFYETLLAKRPS